MYLGRVFWECNAYMSRHVGLVLFRAFAFSEPRLPSAGNRSWVDDGSWEAGVRYKNKAVDIPSIDLHVSPFF